MAKEEMFESGRGHVWKDRKTENRLKSKFSKLISKNIDARQDLINGEMKITQLNREVKDQAGFVIKGMKPRPANACNNESVFNSGTFSITRAEEEESKKARERREVKKRENAVQEEGIIWLSRMSNLKFLDEEEREKELRSMIKRLKSDNKNVQRKLIIHNKLHKSHTSVEKLKPRLNQKVGYMIKVITAIPHQDPPTPTKNWPEEVADQQKEYCPHCKKYLGNMKCQQKRSHIKPCKKKKLNKGKNV